MISRTLFSVAACAALAAGCAGVEATGGADVQVTSAPVGIEDSPQVEYEGRPTYLYQDHWYYRDGGNQWRVRGSEPATLADHRRRLQSQPARPQPRKEEKHEERPAHGHER